MKCGVCGHEGADVFMFSSTEQAELLLTCQKCRDENTTEENLTLQRGRKAPTIWERLETT
jgi:hypothetical protein